MSAKDAKAKAYADAAELDAGTATIAAQIAVDAPARQARREQEEQASRARRALEAAAGESWLHRLSPARSRWPEIRRFDEQAADLDNRQSTLTNEITALREQLAHAEQADREALADWQLHGGDRPQPAAPNVERRIEEAQAEHDALNVARAQVLADKARFVQRHRGRLVRDADVATREAHARYLQVVAELEQARTDLYELRCTSLWASTFPDEAGASMPSNIIAGGLRQPITQALPGYTGGQLTTENIAKLLRADADVLIALETIAQHNLRAGRQAHDHGHDPSRSAVWAGSPEEAELNRATREAALRYESVFGEGSSRG